MTSEAIKPEQLYGTWRLVTATAVDAAGQAIRPPYGPIPMGRLVLNRDGRMMAVICDGRNILPEGEKRAYASYCGNYRVEKDRLITTVDAALIPERVGGEQVRRLDWRNGQLVLIPPRRADGEQREIFWELNGPA